LGVNNSGQVVGDYVDAADVMHGFIYSGTTFTSFDVPGSTATTINGLNDVGQIVGFFVDQNGNTIGFEAQIPEPVSFTLAGVGLLGLGLLRLRRART
jgi:hypothetical protein